GRGVGVWGGREERGLLIGIEKTSRSIRRAKNGVDLSKPPPPLLAFAGFLTPRKSVELITRTAFVLSVSRTLGLNCCTKRHVIYRIHRPLIAGRLGLLSFRLFLTV